MANASFLSPIMDSVRMKPKWIIKLLWFIRRKILKIIVKGQDSILDLWIIKTIQAHFIHKFMNVAVKSIDILEDPLNNKKE